MTSGMTRGELTMPTKNVRPVNRLNRVSAKAASVPSTTDAHAVRNAICSDSLKPAMISASWASAAYQRSDQPPQWVTSGLALKLSKMSVTIGRYKKRNTAPIHRADVTRPALTFTRAPAPCFRPGIC